MFRLVVVSLAFLALSQVAFATYDAIYDVSTMKDITIQFTDEHVVSNSKNLASYAGPCEGGVGETSKKYIGNLELGAHRSDEKIMRRVLIFKNPTNDVQTSSVILKTEGRIHYICVENDDGNDTHAVVCDKNAIGDPTAVISLRVSSRTTTKFYVLVASD